MSLEDRSPRWLGNDHPGLTRFWHPVAASSEITDQPKAVRLLGQDWCLARIDGTLTALVDRCPHRFMPLSAGRVVDGSIECVYHGYRFDSDGTCVEIPAVGLSAADGDAIPPKAHCRPAHGVIDHLGLVWLAPEEPLAPLPDVPEHDDPEFVNCPVPPSDWQAGAAQMVDNFLDQGHLAFIHLNTIGAVEDRVVPDYRLTRTGVGFTVEHRHITQSLAASQSQGQSANVAERHDVFVFTPPHHVYLRIHYPAEEAVLAISFCHQPVDATTTRLHVYDYRNDIEDTAADRQATVDYQLSVGMEDKAVLEQMKAKAVPLDLTAEVHTRADRITMEMRRIMAELLTP